MYSYVRGVGWIVGDFIETMSETREGKVLTLERRTPKVGERYFLMSEDDVGLISVFNDIRGWAFSFETLQSLTSDVADEIVARGDPEGYAVITEFRSVERD